MKTDMQHIGALSLRRFAAAAALLAVLAACGCRLGEGRIVPSPLSYREQEQAVRNLIPEGTPRDEAVARLTEVGIAGGFGQVGRSIYYCDVWTRETGERWHLNVALLFDEAGRFYDVRPAEADTGPL